MSGLLRREPGWFVAYRPVLALTAAAALAGALLAAAVTSRQPATELPLKVDVISAGPARLSLPSAWTPRRSVRIPGFEHAAAAETPTTELALDTRMPENALLLPSVLLRAAAEPDTRRVVKAGGLSGWAYDLHTAKRSLSVIVLPTTRGVVTLVCSAGASLLQFAAYDCEDALGDLQLVGAAPSAPEPETAMRIGAGAVITQLDAVRVSQRRALAVTRSPALRVRASRRIADAYGTAAARLGPLADGAARAIVRTLRALARKHRALARAGAQRAAAAQRDAGRAIGRGERRLAAELRALGRRT